MQMKKVYMLITLSLASQIAYANSEKKEFYHDDHPMIIINKNSTAIITDPENNIANIQIETPNTKDISHNKYDRFDVSEEGIILDNSKANANYIINEVIHGAKSLLEGNIHIEGKAAHVVIANPNGIICENCHFSNTLSESLVTGNPLFKEDNLSGYKLASFIADRDIYPHLDKNHFGKVTFIKNANNTKRDFNNLNIFSNNINIAKGFIRSNNDINIYSGATNVDFDKKDTHLSINGVRLELFGYRVSNNITIGNEKNNFQIQGLAARNKINIKTLYSTINNHGIITADNSLKKGLQITLDYYSTFNNYGAIATKGFTANINNYSHFINHSVGLIINPMTIKDNHRYGLTIKDTATPIDNLVLNINHKSDFVNEGVLKSIRLYTKDKALENIISQNAQLHTYIKSLKIKESYK